ncbi:MAG: sugar transferase [Candidatus Kapabacteria bacterium]|nr:sugar transferase [Candidatus Kapabacteria bacterium]
MSSSTEQIKEKKSKELLFSFLTKDKYSYFFTLICVDILSITISVIIQFFARYHKRLLNGGIDADIVIVFVIGLILLIIYWLFLFLFAGLYKNWYERSPMEELFLVFKTSFIGTVISVFVVQINETSRPRMMFLVYFIIFTSIVCLGRMLARWFHRNLRIRKLITTKAMLIGSVRKINQLYNDLIESKDWGYQPIGAIIFEEIEKIADLNPKIQNLGAIEDLEKIININRPDEALIATDTNNHKDLLNLVAICSSANLRVKIQPDLYVIFTGQTRASHIYGIPLIEVNSQLLKPWEETTKRLFDIVFSSFVILCSFPLWGLLAIAIKLESRGPVLYKQFRVGKGGKQFLMFKFRSMRQNSDKENVIWTQVNDPRVTFIGRFIRKTHFDEIPQFFNVLRGDMSIVGPRPEVINLVEMFTAEIPYYIRRLIVRPGITGWWQVKYTKFEFSYQEVENRLLDDFYYIENMSLRFDIEIIIRTLWCVIKGHGQA